MCAFVCVMCAAKEAEEGDKAGGKPSAKGGKEEGPQAEEEESDDDVRRQRIDKCLCV